MNRVRDVPSSRVVLGGSKRKADISPKKESKKRSALGDVTNASKKKQGGVIGGKDGAVKANKVVAEKTREIKVEKPSLIPVMNQDPSRVTRARSKSLKGNEEPLKEEAEKTISGPGPSKSFKGLAVKATTKVSSTKRTKSKKSENVPLPSVSISEEESMYQTAVSSTPILKHLNDQDDETVEECQTRKRDEEAQKLQVPEGVVDFDEETRTDPFQVGLYAADIFAYYRRRETRFPVRKYLDKQTELNRNMRSILVDWMVEVQESFEMNHETLYLAIKLVDLYLCKVIVKREKLQLVGTTALYIAAKYDERCPPVIDDFCYICDDAYSQKEVIAMEEKMLRTLQFDIGVPLSYRFLRRYARCAHLDMETLTLSRFILEMSQMEYDFIDVIDSKLAAATLYLALKLMKVSDPWNLTLQYYSGYSVEDISELTQRIYQYLRRPMPQVKTIRSKYSHKVFYEVAKIPLPENLQL